MPISSFYISNLLFFVGYVLVNICCFYFLELIIRNGRSIQACFLTIDAAFFHMENALKYPNLNKYTMSHKKRGTLFLTKAPDFLVDFCARQHICYSAYMLSPVRLSVRPSVTRVDQSKTVEVRIMQLSPPGSPMT